MLKFLSSLKLAVILIAAIAVMSILATIYPDADAFNSWSFRILMIAFFLNLSLCTIKLLPGFRKQLQRSAGDVPMEGAYRIYGVQEEELTAWLKESHYKVDRLEQNGQVRLLAQKGKWSLAAPHLLHISLLVILVGALISTFNTQGYVMGQVGQTRPFPDELNSAYQDSTVEILDFQTTYDAQQSIDNWVTHFNLYINGKLVGENAETKVNSPYRYGSLMIYQNSYDYRYLMEVQGAADAEMNTTYGLPDNQPSTIAGQTVVAATIDGKPYVQISDHKNPPRGQFVEPGDSLILNDEGATIMYLDTAAYTILEVKTRRGTYVVFLGFILATLASLLFFSGRYREMRILAEQGDNQCKIWCFSKNAVITEEMEETLAQNWMKRQQEAE